MDVMIVGDGPGGLSAALFLAKAGKQVVVFGKDETAMNWALLYNYLGIEAIGGTELQQRSRAQVEKLGATLRDAQVTSLVASDGGFTATLASGETVSAPIVVLSEGKKPALARALGCAEVDGRIQVDDEGLTSVPGVYAVGRMVRPTRSQAIISAGDGAKAALDILAREAGRDVQDWDSPPKED
jgi:thioredoxin reductase (NADPH)